MWLDSLKAAGYSTNTLNTRRCQMSALSRALEGDPRDVEGDDLLAHFAAKDWNVYGQINVYGVTTKSERHKRSYWTRTADGNGIGGRKAPVPYGS